MRNQYEIKTFPLFVILSICSFCRLCSPSFPNLIKFYSFTGGVPFGADVANAVLLSGRRFLRFAPFLYRRQCVSGLGRTHAVHWGRGCDRGVGRGSFRALRWNLNRSRSEAVSLCWDEGHLRGALFGFSSPLLPRHAVFHHFQ